MFSREWGRTSRGHQQPQLKIRQGEGSAGGAGEQKRALARELQAQAPRRCMEDGTQGLEAGHLTGQIPVP